MTFDPSLVHEAASLLQEVTAAQPALHDVRRLADELQRSRPGVTVRVVQDREPYDGASTYNLLLSSSAGTLSLSFSPPAGTPWPLRGVVRVSDDRVLRVNDTQLSIGDTLASLDFVWSDRDLLVRLVDSCLVKEELERHPVDVSDEELQTAADAYRRSKGLLTERQTQEWLGQRGLTPSAFADLVERLVVLRKLRRRIARQRSGEGATLPAGDDLTAADPVDGSERAAFEEWLSEQRAVADVEWFWLTERQTSAIGG